MLLGDIQFFRVEAREKNGIIMHTIKMVKSRPMDSVTIRLDNDTFRQIQKTGLASIRIQTHKLSLMADGGRALSRFSSWTIRGLSVGFDIESLTIACKPSVSLLGSVATPGAYQLVSVKFHAIAP